jgi:hypothetical protein
MSELLPFIIEQFLTAVDQISNIAVNPLRVRREFFNIVAESLKRSNLLLLRLRRRLYGTDDIIQIAYAFVDGKGLLPKRGQLGLIV